MIPETANSDPGYEVAKAPVRLRDLFVNLAGILARGDEQIARPGAGALRRQAVSVFGGAPCRIGLLDRFAELVERNEPFVGGVRQCPQSLDWRHSASRDGRISGELSQRMLTVEPVGDTGMAYDKSCRVGLFAQDASVDYPVRTHKAEELFVMVAGSGYRRQSGMPERIRLPGDRIRHASGERHASRTAGEPLIALWVRAGDARFETYELSG